MISDVYTWTVTDSAGSTSYLGCAHIESLENAHAKKRVRCQNQPYAFDLKKMVAKVKGEADRTLERVAVKTKPYSARCKAVAGLAPVTSAAAGNGAPAADSAPKKAPAKTGSKRKKGADDGECVAAAGWSGVAILRAGWHTFYRLRGPFMASRGLMQADVGKQWEQCHILENFY